MTIKAKVLLDSVSRNGTRLTTFELYYPRMVHSEINTHRVFSRNASSSRAIPTVKRLLSIIRDPAVPVQWGGNQPGMVAKGQLRALPKLLVISLWYLGCYLACLISAAMHLCGVHKQIANRITEPWSHIKVVLSSTEWENFWKLRISSDADPTMRALALAMRAAWDDSEPVERAWHLPYLRHGEVLGEGVGLRELALISAARCARVSYVDHDGKETDPEKDKALALKLFQAGHMSPFEHVAYISDYGMSTGNFREWAQFRKYMEAQK